MSMRPVCTSLLLLAIALSGSTTAIAGEATPPTPPEARLHHAVALRDAGIVLTSLGATSTLFAGLMIGGALTPGCVDHTASTRCENYMGIAALYTTVPAAGALLAAGIPMWTVGAHRVHETRLVLAPALVPHGAGASVAVTW